MTSIVVLGAGPAGLGAALRLARRGFDVIVVERSAAVGGNAGSFELEGLRVDYGSHRLHRACPPQVLSDIRAMLGEDLLDRPRHGRIRLGGRWLHFPLKPLDLAFHAPPPFLLGVLLDAAWKPRPDAGSESFASVLERGLGRTVCRHFYFPYARKIWGMEPAELDAEQARRRVSASSRAKMLWKILSAVPRLRPPGSGRFFYPKRGYGQISEAYYEAARRAGARVLFRTTVSAVEIEASRAVAVRTSSERGQARLPARQILSTIPLPLLVRLAEPAAPREVLALAASLRYRALTLVYLVLAADRFTQYDAHYFPEPGLAITRLSEPKNYGLQGLPGITVLCAELPCSREDPLWQASDSDLGALVIEALAKADLPVRAPVRCVATRRLEQAYPIYARGYRDNLERLDAWVGGIDGLLTLGRQGLFAHDNTHHTLAMAYAASNCIADDGRLDRDRWALYRREFESHVVED